MAIPWHRFLKVGLRQLLKDTCFEVYDEFDLSDQVQRLDFAVIRIENAQRPYPDPGKMPDGLRDLRDHNLVSYKSMNEPFDRFALNELIGHTVSYAKLQARDDWRAFSDTLGLIALSTRKPSTSVISRLLHETETESVYEIDCTGWKMTCVVINQAPPDDRNWLWQLLYGDRSRWKSGSISAILNKLTNQLKEMGVLDPEIEAFENKILESWAEELSIDQVKRLSQVKAVVAEIAEEVTAEVANETAKKIAKKMLEAGQPVDLVAEISELPLEVVEKLKAEA